MFVYSLFCWLPMFFGCFINDTRPPLLLPEIDKTPTSQLATSLRPIPTQHLKPGAHFDYMLPKAAVAFLVAIFIGENGNLWADFKVKQVVVRCEVGGCFATHDDSG